MLIWIALFLIVLAISLVLAIQSMADYETRPAHFSTPYTLFLVTKEKELNQDILQDLHRSLLQKGFILSLERLFRGGRRALVLYGPSAILKPLSGRLGLIELEDYSKREIKPGQGVVAWEVGRKAQDDKLVVGNIFQNIPEFTEEEEFWWQVVTQPTKDSFKSIIRAVVLAVDQRRASALQNELLQIGKDKGLSLLPQAYSTPQMVKLYQDRSIPVNFFSKGPKGVILNLQPDELQSLLSSSSVST